MIEAAAAAAVAAAAAGGATSREEQFLFGYEHAEELLDIVVRRVVGRVVGRVDAVDEEAVARVQVAVLAAATSFAALVGSAAIQVAVPFGPGIVAADEMKEVMWVVEQHHYQQD